MNPTRRAYFTLRSLSLSSLLAVFVLGTGGCAQVEPMFSDFHGITWQGVAPGDAPKWVDAGFSKEAAERWARVEAANPEADGASVVVEFTPRTARRYEDMGVTPETAAIWEAVYGGNTDGASSLVSHGVRPQQFAEWGRSGMVERNQTRWATFGYSAETTATLYAAPVDYGLVSNFHAAGSSPDDMDTWRVVYERIGLTRTRELIESGVNPEFAKSQAVHGWDPEVVRPLFEAGLSESDVQAFRDSGANWDDIEAWYASGLPLETIRRYTRHGIPPTVAQRAEKQCDDSPMIGGVAQLGPRDVRGQCAIIMAEVRQIISPTEALILETDGYHEGYVKLDYDEGIPAGEGSIIRYGIVLGIGVFQYESMSGQRTIPHVELIDY